MKNELKEAILQKVLLVNAIRRDNLLIILSVVYKKCLYFCSSSLEEADNLVKADEIQLQVQAEVNSIFLVLAPVLRGLGYERATITNIFDCRDRRLFNRSSTNIFEVGGHDTNLFLNIFNIFGLVSD
jgi:hypothetical protein